MHAMTLKAADALESTPALDQPGPLAVAQADESHDTLSDRLANHIAQLIDTQALRPGSRLPSIRQQAQAQGVSRSTVVDAYDKLVARGLVNSRRGSGFYVRTAQTARVVKQEHLQSTSTIAPVDIPSLLRSMFSQIPTGLMPGAGVFPKEWLDSQMLATALRFISRHHASDLLQYGLPKGLLALREQLVIKLGQHEIAAHPEGIVTTTGVTQAIDLVVRTMLQPGDTIFVEDPCWFTMFARFAMSELHVVGIPRLADGPDIAALEALLKVHRPKMFFVQSLLHNPTSTNVSARVAYQILRLAEQHQFYVFDDDVYGDLMPTHSTPTRLAAIGGLDRVIYASGFSKTLAASLRLGFIATTPHMADRFAQTKMLAGLTTPELPELVVHRVLAEGQYRRHCERLRHHVARAHDRTAKLMQRLGLSVFTQRPARISLSPVETPPPGMFLWVDCGMDSSQLAVKAAQRDLLFAPGALFNPQQQPSTYMRFSVQTSANVQAVRFLQECFA